MHIATKSVQAKKSPRDGIRICIMRRIKPEFEFDMWLPILSPSTELLKQHLEHEVDWKTFQKLFTKTVLNKQKRYIKLLGEMAKKENLTLLCWEETPEACHRSLVLKQIKKEFPKTTTLLK